MKKFIYKSLIALGALVLSTATSCVGDLDLEPNDPNSTGQIADSEAFSLFPVKVALTALPMSMVSTVVQDNTPVPGS